MSLLEDGARVLFSGRKLLWQLSIIFVKYLSETFQTVGKAGSIVLTPFSPPMTAFPYNLSYSRCLGGRVTRLRLGWAVEYDRSKVKWDLPLKKKSKALHFKP